MATDLAPLARTALAEELDELHKAVRQRIDPLTDTELWTRPADSGNSIGHLILHLTGNLNHFVGAHLGKTGYVRDREREFTEANPPAREALLGNFDAAVTLFRTVVGGLDADTLASPHPEKRFGTVLKALVHLVSHFALHRGQISYIVRMVKPGK